MQWKIDALLRHSQIGEHGRNPDYTPLTSGARASVSVLTSALLSSLIVSSLISFLIEARQFTLGVVMKDDAIMFRR